MSLTSTCMASMLEKKELLKTYYHSQRHLLTTFPCSGPQFGREGTTDPWMSALSKQSSGLPPTLILQNSRNLSSRR